VRLGITTLLQQAGFTLGDQHAERAAPIRVDLDDETELVERLLRTLLRSTQVNEETLRRRFGRRANRFFDDVLPALLRVGALEEIPYLGSGQGRRFRLAIPMTMCEEALADSGGRFDRFLGAVENRVAAALTTKGSRARLG
jgi:hypothetical protein